MFPVAAQHPGDDLVALVSLGAQQFLEFIPASAARVIVSLLWLMRPRRSDFVASTRMKYMRFHDGRLYMGEHLGIWHVFLLMLAAFAVSHCKTFYTV